MYSQFQTLKGLFTLNVIHLFQVHHSHQASASILASKFKWVRDRFKNVNTDAWCEHGLKLK